MTRENNFMARIGLVAGYGKLPIIFSKVAKSKGDTVIGLGIKGITSDELEDYVDKMHWVEWGKLQKALLLVATERIKEIIMLGKIGKDMVFKNDKNMDEEAKKILSKDKKDYTILNGVKDVLAKFGVKVINATEYLSELMPSKGVITKKEPAKNEWDDIEYGKTVAKELAKFDIGQTVIIKDKTVIALEAAEGTDETITRAGSLVKGGFVVVKVARPAQDMRFDVPIVGVDTIESLIKAGGSTLALEEKHTILMDKEEVIRLADQNGIAVAVV